MNLTLSDDDAALLREVLDSVVRDLSYEIADTDRADFRAGLKERRDQLARILGEVGGPLPRD